MLNIVTHFASPQNFVILNFDSSQNRVLPLVSMNRQPHSFLAESEKHLSDLEKNFLILELGLISWQIGHRNFRAWPY